MIALLLIFVVLALFFGIGGAIEISLWFLGLLLVAAVLLGLAVKMILSR